eukprot:RCo040718
MTSPSATVSTLTSTSDLASIPGAPPPSRVSQLDQGSGPSSSADFDADSPASGVARGAALQGEVDWLYHQLAEQKRKCAEVEYELELTKAALLRSVNLAANLPPWTPPAPMAPPSPRVRRPSETSPPAKPSPSPGLSPTKSAPVFFKCL